MIKGWDIVVWDKKLKQEVSGLHTWKTKNEKIYKSIRNLRVNCRCRGIGLGGYGKIIEYFRGLRASEKEKSRIWINFKKTNNLKKNQNKNIYYAS